MWCAIMSEVSILDNPGTGRVRHAKLSVKIIVAVKDNNTILLHIDKNFTNNYPLLVEKCVLLYRSRTFI